MMSSPVLPRYEQAVASGSGALGALVLNARVSPLWLPGGKQFIYRRDTGGGGFEYIRVDTETGERGPAFDHVRLARALSAATGVEADPGKLPISRPDFPEGPESLRVLSDWKYRLIDLNTYEIRDADPPTSGAAPAPSAGPAPTPPPPPEPARRVVAESHNLAVIEGDGTRTQLTQDGTAEAFYGNVHVSPDGRYAVAFRTVPGSHPEMHLVESSPADGVRPKHHSHVYELPGDDLDTHELCLFDLVEHRRIPVAADRIDWWGPPAPRWTPDGTAFTYEQTYRGFHRMTVAEVTLATGAHRYLIDERSDTFLPPMKKMIRYLDATREIIWASERDGWCHLYLIDMDTGSVKSRITSGEWVVRGIESVDEAKRELLIRCSGDDASIDPYLVRYARVSFDGTRFLCLTPGDGQHEIAFSPGGDLYFDTYSRVDLPPVTELRRTADGTLVCEVERADATPFLAEGRRLPEPFRAKGRDGRTDIWGVIYRPSNLDEKAKYPIIEDIYAGPQDSFVPKAFSAAGGMQSLAELGFIVVKIDGMGTSNRSKAFHDVASDNLGDGGFPDRIAWMKSAAAAYPYLDTERVGIYGHSAGGYNAARALLAFGDFYKAGAAMAGNHDHRTDKVWWNELWMGYPVGKHYEEQSNITQAGNLKGNLLLVHGELDRNVNPSASTLQLANALIKANKDFDLLIYPGAGHGFPGTYVTRRMWDFFVTHLRGETPPAGFELKFAGADNSCHIRVRNDRPTPVELLWVNFEGQAQKYGDIAPGETRTQHTFYGHTWRVRADGNDIDQFTAAPEALDWLIPAPR